LLALGLVGGCGEAQHAAAPELPNPVHVAADSERARADGSESHPFPSLADAAAAIGHDQSWQGTVLVHAGRYEHPLDVVLPPTAALEIEAGATFAMGPNVSLHVRGEVNARGSEGKPISFTWLAEGEHWSGFTVTGPSPSESVFEHVIVEHGYESVEEQEALRKTHGWFYYRFKGGESPADCYDRTSSFLDSMMRQVERKQARRVLIVTHGLTIRCFVMRFLHLGVGEFDAMANPDNCAVITLGDRSALGECTFTSGWWGVTGLSLRAPAARE
jgi:hypothetical protein